MTGEVMNVDYRRIGRASAVGAVLLLVGPFIALKGPTIISEFEERQAQDRALAPFVEQARNWSLSYENVAAGAAASVGRPVIWCVDHHSVGESHVDGNLAWKVHWTDESAVPVIPDSKHGCGNMVAVVRGADAAGVLLEYKGQP